MEVTPQPNSRRLTRRHLLLAGALAIVVAIAGWAVWRSGLVQTLEDTVARLREAGPVAFFLAMALLPAIGFPMMAFTLAAGPVFGPVMGTGWVILWSLLAVAANLMLSYWLANRAVRPLVRRLLAFFNFRLPESPAGHAWRTTLIVRLTPGPPFWVQSYVLGMIGVPLVPYVVVSVLVMTGYVVAIVWGGNALAEGNGRYALAALGVLVVSIAALQWLRRKTARSRAESLAASAP